MSKAELIVTAAFTAILTEGMNALYLRLYAQLVTDNPDQAKDTGFKAAATKVIAEMTGKTENAVKQGLKPDAAKKKAAEAQKAKLAAEKVLRDAANLLTPSQIAAVAQLVALCAPLGDDAAKVLYAAAKAAGKKEEKEEIALDTTGISL